ncbi:MAG: hypothetical protein NXI24_09720 [bacterium]|nr:hypothetical protein [bacterium]
MISSILRPSQSHGPASGDRPALNRRLSLVTTAVLLFASTVFAPLGRSAELGAQAPGSQRGGVERPVRLALFPFVRGKNVSDFEYEQISAAFHLSLSRAQDFQIVPRFELGRILNAAEEAGETFESPEPIYALAAANNIDLLVFGSVGAEVRLQHRGVDLRSVGLKVEIVNVPRKQVFNTVAWSTSHLHGQNIQEGEKIADLATMTAGKLTWRSPDFFPIRVVFDASSREIIPRSFDADEAYKTRVRERLDKLSLPVGVEMDSVLVNVREKREISTLGAVGCVTLVGWLFVPFYEIDYDLDILARVKYIDESGVEYREFADAGHESENFHFTADAEKYEQPTLKLLGLVTEQIYDSIRGDRRLFQDRSALLRKLFLKPADVPENI